jgi:hypothetical protein
MEILLGDVRPAGRASQIGAFYELDSRHQSGGLAPRPAWPLAHANNATVPLRFNNKARTLLASRRVYTKELVMPGFKRFVCLSAAFAVLACAPIVPAVAGGHGFGHVHGWGLGRGLVGAVVGLATLPLVIASAAISASVPDAPQVAPQPYYAPAGAYYPPAPVSQPAPRSYYAPPAYYAPSAYAPRAYYAPRPYYAPRGYSAPAPGRSYYGGAGGYRAGGYAYPRR